MKYQELKEGIERRLNAAAEDFFTIGYYLRQISEGALFLEDGYKNIWDFAKGEYGLSTASASRYMAINMKFSGDGGQTMQAKYIGMGSSKLQEMLTLPDEDLDRVTKETTVREIRAMKAEKKKPLSYFGWPAKVYPEGSLLTTKGCAPEGGRGGHDCFSCYRDCAIRQEETQCYTAPLGSPHRKICRRKRVRRFGSITGHGENKEHSAGVHLLRAKYRLRRRRMACLFQVLHDGHAVGHLRDLRSIHDVYIHAGAVPSGACRGADRRN